MEGQFAAPFHFAAEFLVLVVALGASFDALRARRAGAGRWSLAQAAGFGILGAAQVVHGSLAAQADGDVLVLVLRSVAFAILAVSARPAAAAVAPPFRDALLPAGAVPALFLPGAHAIWAFLPAAGAIAVAARGVRAHRIDRSPTTYAFAAAFAAFGIAEVATAIAPSTGGALLIFAHVTRAVGALVLARWLWTSIVRSVRMRFVAAFVVVLTVAVLVVSTALNLVIGNTLQANELRRLAEAGRARVSTIRNLGDNAVFAAEPLARNEGITEGLAAGNTSRISLTSVFQLIPADFIMLVDRRGRVLDSSETSAPPGPPHRFPRTEEIALAGTDVIQQALTGTQTESAVAYTFIDSKGVVHSQVGIVGAWPSRLSGRIVGVVAIGYRIDRAYLIGVRQDTQAEATVLAGDQLAATTFRNPDALSRAFRKLAGPLRITRENGTIARRIVGIARTQYVTAFVPLRSSDNQVIGLIALSRLSTALSVAQRNVTRTLFLITLAAVAMAAVLAWLSGGRVTRPIRSLTGAARELREGKLETRTQVASADEVGTLGTAFNEMAQELQRKTSDLRASAATEATLRARIEAILQSMGDGLIATDAQGKIVTVNRAAEAMFRLRAERALGSSLSEVMHGVTVIGRSLADAAMTGGATEGSLRRPDGSTLTVALTAAPLLDASGVTVGRVVVLRDVTREHEAERMKSEFLANVSHELRTPITPIKGYAEIMSRKSFPRDKQRKFLEGILDSTGRLERVVEILVDFAAMEAGRLKPRIEPLPVRDLIDKVAARWRERDNQHQFVRRGGTGLPPILGDPKLLGRSLDELMDNAVKFSPDGGRIEITAEAHLNGARGKKPSRVRITVKDNGIGIEPQQMPELFQDFRQLDGSDTRNFGGMGLGLAYVKRIASVHGGDVQVESVPGRGSAFSLVLPTADAQGKGRKRWSEQRLSAPVHRTSGRSKASKKTVKKTR